MTAMRSDCLLTLVFPASLEEEIVDHLLEHPEWAEGFSCMPIEGHGVSQALHGSSEQVRGRSRRLMVQIVMRQDNCAKLIAHFRETLPNPEVTYWRTPIDDFGRFA